MKTTLKTFPKYTADVVRPEQDPWEWKEKFEVELRILLGELNKINPFTEPWRVPTAEELISEILGEDSDDNCC